MLDSETKRRIDSARDILVGKVPDPKSQVEQITIALVYKFMDDMDKESLEMGGKASFFVGEFEKYGWSRIFDPRLGGFEMLALYADAITRMGQNPNLPQLFRDIFKNAYLPYRDPETLKLFLKTINDFSYDHSERLGDAFEYLLSVLGSQGDAGQFRTPRHIIDFMVQVVKPQKNEKILDPACGTAGFLISAYKYILNDNTVQTSPAREGWQGRGQGDQLSPDDKKKLLTNFKGYDISPDMVRLSLVNLYLHGFVQPQIYEYDTLTSEERWSDYADVILANPPFMSPKGGIKPHKRFSVQSNRSEVLFVDYMAEHLTPGGRAAIIVPEGIIFQSSGANKQLRKYLVEQNYLWAVVSLPAGVFNPYSAVKTSILLMDRALAKKTDQILFLKIEADGYDLGAQRRMVEKNNLPDALNLLFDWQNSVLNNQVVSFDLKAKPCSALLVPKSRLAQGDEYTLTGDRYRISTHNVNQKWPMVPLGDICEFINGMPFKPDSWEKANDGGLPIIRIQNLNNPNADFNYYSRQVNERYYVNNGDLLFSWSGSRGTSFGAHIWKGSKGILNQHIFRVIFSNSLIKEYLKLALNKAVGEIEENLHGGVGLVHITKGDLERIKIPVPTLEVQREIVKEIEGCEYIIESARQIIAAWKPNLALELEQEGKFAGVDAWNRKPLVEVCDRITDGTHITPKYTDTGVPFLRVTDITGSNSSKKFISEHEHKELIKRCRPEKGDVLYSKNGTIGIAKLVDWDWEFSIFVSLAMLRPKQELLDGQYLEFFLNSNDALAQAFAHSKSGTVTNLHLVEIKQIEIPLPPLDKQRTMVARIKAERGLVESNRRLVEIYETKVIQVIERVWER